MKLQSVLSLKKELLSEGLGSHIVTSSALPVEARAVRAAFGPEPLAVARPTPVALGIRGRGGNYRLAVRVQHAMPGMNAVLERISKRARGEMDMRVVGRVFKQAPWHRKRNRPLRIGGSIGHVDITAGTLGCFVAPRSGTGDDDLILSNNHVLANENDASRGDRIIQPGDADGGKRSKDVVGHLQRFIRLKKMNNAVDAATASIADGIEYYYNWLHTRGPIVGIRDEPLDEGDIVYKVGRTTGLRKGRVSAIEVDSLVVGYDSGDLEFDGQIEIEPVGSKPFSLGGDSGSLIFDSRRRAVALLFAGNDSDATYANPIRTVLDTLKVDLVY